MSWSLKIGSVKGIGIYIHWTFLLIFGWLFVAHYTRGDDLQATLKGMALVGSVFGCVLLHELGHALAARQFSIATRDITLLPIGGVARLERMPEEPLQELWVAIAGPLVNVAIAVLIAVALAVTGEADWRVPEDMVAGSFWMELLQINIALVLFNLLPAFPMDGGRVLRALLATRMDYVKATQTAAAVGQFMAILFGFIGLLGSNFFLVFIALFVYLGAQQEAVAAQSKSLFRGVPVQSVMITRFKALDATDTLRLAASELITGTQQDFPVLDGEAVIGLLTRDALVKALAEGGLDRPVHEVMIKGCRLVQDNEMLDRTLERMREGACSTLPVIRSGRLVGLLNLENVGEFLMIQSALTKYRRRAEVANVYRPAD